MSKRCRTCQSPATVHIDFLNLHFCQSCIEKIDARIAEINQTKTSEQPETIETLRSCRDHWKTAFEHERQNVIRLRNLLQKLHDTDCRCPDCLLVKQHSDVTPQP